MNLLIIGYGKMGKSIETIAKERGHNIAGIVDVDNQSFLEDIDPSTVDVAIEFSQPDSAFENIRTCLERGIGSNRGLALRLEILVKRLDDQEFDPLEVIVFAS